MMSTFRMAVTALFAVFVFGVIGSESNAQLTSGTNPVATAIDVFDIELRVDQIAQSVTVNVRNGPVMGFVLLEAVVVGQNSAGVAQTHLTLVSTNAFGEATFTMPLMSSSGTGSEALIRGLYAEPGFTTIYESSHWVLAGHHFSTGDALANVSANAYSSILNDVKANDIGIYVPALPFDKNAPLVSNAFVLDDPALASMGPLSGSGTWYAAGPLSMYQTTSGPAGVFTAN